MNKPYETTEPNEINEKMLQKAIEEQGPQDQAGRIAKKEGIQNNEVVQLRLDYRSKKFLWFIVSLRAF